MIELPTFEDSHGGALMVCGQLRTKDVEVLRRLKRLPDWDKPMVVDFGRKGNPFAAMLLAGGPKPFGHAHLHVNIIRRRSRAFASKLPKANASAEEFQKAIEPFIGQKVDVSLSGYFYVPIGDLPADRGLVRAVAVQQDKLEIRQTGGSLALKGAPADSVEWWMRGDGKEVQVELEAELQMTVAPIYLSRAYDYMHSAFRLLVLADVAERANGRAKNH